ncbi:hypothetical protein ACSFCG_13120, partial [Enterococcus faecalis]
KKRKISRIVITVNCPISVGMSNNNDYSKIDGKGPWKFKKNKNQIKKNIKSLSTLAVYMNQRLNNHQKFIRNI